MSKPKKLLKDYFTEDFHTPNTAEVRKYLEENFIVSDQWGASYDYITPSISRDFTESTYLFATDCTGGKFIDTETFKEIIGMTNNTNKIPELIAGRHFVKLKGGQYAMVMDGYINYVKLGKTNRDLSITGWDYIKVLTDNPNREVVEIFNTTASVLWCCVFNQSDFDSGKYTIWKKQEKTQQQIEMEALGEQITALQKQYEALKQASE